jgi:hypothetical protein
LKPVMIEQNNDVTLESMENFLTNYRSVQSVQSKSQERVAPGSGQLG